MAVAQGIDDTAGVNFGASPTRQQMHQQQLIQRILQRVYGLVGREEGPMQMDGSIREVSIETG